MGMSATVFEVHNGDLWTWHKADKDVPIARSEALQLGVNIIRVRASLMALDVRHSSPGLLIDGARKCADILVASKSSVLFASNLQDVTVRVRVYSSSAHVLVSSGAQRLFIVEGMLQQLLQVHLH